MILLPISSLFLPALGMYLPARWIPCRWTTYDLAAGATWGEENSQHITCIGRSAASDDEISLAISDGQG